jgi:site-specific DNA-cytosine methylase
MRAVELFAGGGGASQGLEAAGVEALACFEYDEAASAVARAAGFPSHCCDVREVDWPVLLDEHGPIDLIWASPPCQAFSSAGKRKGASDERNGWPWTLDAVDHLKPRWLMAENVTGLTMHSGEHCGNVDRCPACYLHRVILPELSRRFAWVGWAVSDAADFGTPQHRRRICIVAGPEPVRWPKATHADPDKCLGLFDTRKPWVTVREALNLDAYVVTAGTTGEGRPTSPTSPTATIGSKGNAYAVRCIGGGRIPTADPKDHRTYRDLTEEPCTTLAAVQIGNAGPWLEREIWDATGAAMVDDPREGDEWHQYIGCGVPKESRESGFSSNWWHGRRRLTVRECRILMGWDERYDALLEQQTKTAAYRILGNGVAPVWAEAHVRAVLEADARLV